MKVLKHDMQENSGLERIGIVLGVEHLPALVEVPDKGFYLVCNIDADGDYRGPVILNNDSSGDSFADLPGFEDASAKSFIRRDTMVRLYDFTLTNIKPV